MKITYSIALLLLCNCYIYAAAGFFDSFAIVNVAGGGNTFYDLGAATGNTDFNGANLGSLAQGESLFLGGQIRTFKNTGSDVTGVNLFYRIYPSGSPSGAFTSIAYPFQWNFGDSGAPGELKNSGDQQWGTDVNGNNLTDAAVDILNGTSLAVGDYTLEVYVVVTTNGVDAATNIFDSGGGSNYSATFTLTAAMPITLSFFTVKEQGGKTDIDFVTITEINNDFFEIHHSSDGRHWEVISTINGAGNTNEEQHYHYVDKTPHAGQNYYRLKQVDFDGQFEIFPMVSVWITKVGNDIGSMISPNPSSALTRVGIINGTTCLKLSNINGQTVLERQLDADQDSMEYLLDVSYLLDGIYQLLLIDINGRILHTEKLVKQ